MRKIKVQRYGIACVPKFTCRLVVGWGLNPAPSSLSQSSSASLCTANTGPWVPDKEENTTLELKDPPRVVNKPET